MFSQIFDVWFPSVGQFFGSLVAVATMPFNDFVGAVLAGDFVQITAVNLLTGEDFSFYLSPVSSIVRSLLGDTPFGEFLGQVLSFFLLIPEFIVNWIFKSIVSVIPVIGTSQTWVSLLIIFVTFFIPITLFKIVRKIFW